jgi:hypothetical protein
LDPREDLPMNSTRTPVTPARIRLDVGDLIESCVQFEACNPIDPADLGPEHDSCGTGPMPPGWGDVSADDIPPVESDDDLEDVDLDDLREADEGLRELEGDDDATEDYPAVTPEAIREIIEPRPNCRLPDRLAYMTVPTREEPSGPKDASNLKVWLTMTTIMVMAALVSLMIGGTP